jgi:NADH-quinone oxidoreductase subunit J
MSRAARLLGLGIALVLGLVVLVARPVAARAQDDMGTIRVQGAGGMNPVDREVDKVRAELERKVRGTAEQLERGGHEGGAAVAAPAPGSLENSRLAALFFWIFAAGTLGGALFVVTRRNLITAVMGMVGTFFALAGLYLMLYASFLAVIQVLVYAGAIMVLFVFVVMILNRPEDEPWAFQGMLGKLLAGAAILYLVFRLCGVLWDVKDSRAAAISAPRPVPAQATSGPVDFGSVRAVGNVLFRDYLFPFEAVSLVLLAAVVGAIAVARPIRYDEADRASRSDGAG